MSCCETITYRKAIPSEVIEKGDLIMLDLESGYITKAVKEPPLEFKVNTTLVVGVCVSSTNDIPETIIIDGGSSTVVDRENLDGGSATLPTTIIITNGGSAEQNKRDVIEVAYSGQQIVNICSPSRIGDRLCISSTPGKAKAFDYYEFEHRRLRSIGKIIRYVDTDKTQALVLLDIE